MKARPHPLRRIYRALALLAFTALAATAVSACGSSTHKLTAAEVQSQCTNVADVLSDGPDPNADPVGYAQAQVLPLRQLQISDPALHEVVEKLADDYQTYSKSNGLDAAQAVSKEEGVLLNLCPDGEGDQVLPGQVLP